MVSRQPGVALEVIEGETLIRAGSIEEGIERLQHGDWARKIEGHARPGQDEQNIPALGRIFVIGGAQIYNLALAMNCCERILWTRIEREWDCDVWFPKGVFEEQGKNNGWEKKGGRELDEWCGEKGVGESKEENGIGYTVELWEKSRTDAEVENHVETGEAG